MVKNSIVVHIRIPSKIITKIDEIVKKDLKLSTRTDFIRYSILKEIENEMGIT